MPPDIHSHFPPRNRRSHEVCGAGASTFAFALCGQTSGTIIWVTERWGSSQINPNGFGTFVDPSRILLAKPDNQTDLLAVAEEALRSGTVSLVVMELNAPISFLAGRRLQLAAETGKCTALSIIPDGMGNNASETRWHCSPILDPTDSTLQHWKLIKNKTGTLGSWNVRWNAETRRIIVVPQTGD